MQHRTVSILGATGSIGQTTRRLLQQYPDRFTIQTVVAGSDTSALAETAIALAAKHAVVADAQQYHALKAALAGTSITCAAGDAAVLQAASMPADITIAAIVGIAGLAPTATAIAQGNTVAIANKEAIVCAGHLLLDMAKKHGTRILPLDSEHNAIFQIFCAAQQHALDHIALTASGGPFRDLPLQQFHSITPKMACAHPIWPMGRKISVDSATMMNKGLEVIEACHLFDLPVAQVRVLIHPQSIIHGMATYQDGSTLAQLALPDMTVPIAYALGYPERLPLNTPPLDLAHIGNLTFTRADAQRYPCLNLAIEAFKAGSSACITLNAANEVAVDAFLHGKINFNGIYKLIADMLASAPTFSVESLSDVYAVDSSTRHRAQQHHKASAHV